MQSRKTTKPKSLLSTFSLGKLEEKYRKVVNSFWESCLYLPVAWMFLCRNFHVHWERLHFKQLWRPLLLQQVEVISSSLKYHQLRRQLKWNSVISRHRNYTGNPATSFSRCSWTIKSSQMTYFPCFCVRSFKLRFTDKIYN